MRLPTSFGSRFATAVLVATVLASGGSWLLAALPGQTEAASRDAVASGTPIGADEVTAVSAASFQGPTLAPDSIAALFGRGFSNATAIASTLPLPLYLGGVRVGVTDSAGAERPAQLFFVSPTQINCLVPAGTAAGSATIKVTNDESGTFTGSAQIQAVAPGLFSANADGSGAPAALVTSIAPDGSRIVQPAFRFDETQGKSVPLPIDIRRAPILSLFGTGIRSRSALSAVTVKFGDITRPVTYAGAQGEFAGLDQVNVDLLPLVREPGETDLVLTVDGKQANVLKVTLAAPPTLSSVSPSRLRAGDRIPLTFYGQALNNAAGVEFEPPDNIESPPIRPTFSAPPFLIVFPVTFQASARGGMRLVSLRSTVSRSNALPVEIRSGGAPPRISNVSLASSEYNGTATISGRLDFQDPDGDIESYSSISPGDSAGIRFDSSFSADGRNVNCAMTAVGPAVHKPGQTAGAVSFQFSFSPRYFQVRGNTNVRVTLLDWMHHTSNVVSVSLPWHCTPDITVAIR